MKYRYKDVWPPTPRGKLLKRPMVEIEIFGPSNNSIKELALVDSGADYSLFNYEVAEVLGIDLNGAEESRVIGITGEGNFCLKDIEVKVSHLEHRFKIKAGFLKGKYVSALLGQEGFFDANKIKLEKDHDVFEINPIKK